MIIDMYIYVSITESLCCTPETNTILQINYTSVKIKIKNNFKNKNMVNCKIKKKKEYNIVCAA